MFKMFEIVGSSEKSYSDAVKAAVNKLIESGEKVHFFEVSEHRGVAKDSKFKEFQVKLKVAVELNKDVRSHTEEAKNVCPTCLQTTGETGHLCIPATQKDKKCEWCGNIIADERHLCNEKVEKLTYICNSCGRTAVKPEYVCSPKRIE